MMTPEAKEILVAEFKACLAKAATGVLENKQQYAAVGTSGTEAYVYWCLTAEWYVEGELHDYQDKYQQRKVIANLQPGDFFVVPAKLSPRLRLFARTDQEGDCFCAPLASLLENAESPQLRNLLSNKISHAIIALSEFEKELLKTTLKRPIVIKPNQDVKVAIGRMGLCGPQAFWIKGQNLSLLPEPSSSSSKLPAYWLIHPNSAFINEQQEICNIESFSNDVFYRQEGIIQYLNE